MVDVRSGSGDDTVATLVRHLYRLETEWLAAGVRSDSYEISHVVREAIEGVVADVPARVGDAHVRRVVCWVRMDANVLHAFVCVALCTGGSAALLAVYVERAARGRGVGGAAVKAATEWLRKERLCCELPFARCVRMITVDDLYRRMLKGAGWRVSRVDGERHSDGSHAYFEPCRASRYKSTDYNCKIYRAALETT